MISTKEAFDFVDGGRSYSCQVEEANRGAHEAWWWFAVSGDRSRYAPFRADVGDTKDSVRARVVAYYEERLERRGMPHWASRTPAAERS